MIFLIGYTWLSPHVTDWEGVETPPIPGVGSLEFDFDEIYSLSSQMKSACNSFLSYNVGRPHKLASCADKVITNNNI